jgi:hypothetical protein
VSPSVSWVPVAPNRRLASARLRSFRPVRYLRSAGWRVALHRPGDHPDVAVFQKAYSREQLDEARRLKSLGVRIVADFCDNHLWVPEWTPALRDRAERMRELLALADVVVASTPELAEVLEREAAVVDDALELPAAGVTAALAAARRIGGTQVLRLLWFGTAGRDGQTGGLTDLATLLPTLQEVHARQPLHLTVVSNDRTRYDLQISGRLPSRYVPWSRPAFAAAVGRSDVAVIPVTLDPFTRCKTTNRPATALAHGLACIADPVPSYGALGDTIRVAAWSESLTAYAEASLRTADVARGSRLVRALYAPERIREQWSTVLGTALDGPA